ncbi:hypothetical protein OEZ86_009410 [Tetradesmus obliquus]|nr:hypothetical protein OEZ86_009410 [Tetradesmus obliquus]
MDPALEVTPDFSAHMQLSDGVRLHFELFHPRDMSCSKGKVLVVMGAFACKDHFGSAARHLADNGYEVLMYDHRGVVESGPAHMVLMYDHRGVVKSGPPRMEQQTSAMLAADAVALLDGVWGCSTPVHVYGASMGGMVAQQLALLLLPQGRLVSLGLAVTCRGLQPLGGLLGPLIKPQLLRPLLQAWYWDSKPALVRRLMRLVLDRGLLDSVHPSGEKYEEVYFRQWSKTFEQWWTFGSGDHTTGACHACVVLTHYLSERQISVLRDSGVPILCQLSTRDHLIPPAMQFELADKLHAKTVTFPTGHMGMLPWAHRFHSMLLEHFAAGAALRQLQQSQAARDWRVSKAVVAAQAGKSLLSLQLSDTSTDDLAVDVSEWSERPGAKKSESPGVASPEPAVAAAAAAAAVALKKQMCSVLEPAAATN